MAQITNLMGAMVLEKPATELVYKKVAIPVAGQGQVQIKVTACGICRTDLHIIDGELAYPLQPLIPGHEIVGIVSAIGAGVTAFNIGDTVGVAWLGFTCGRCRYCLNGQENLCDNARFTGYTLNGGFAEYTVADERFCFAIPSLYANAQGAPLLCAGLIGYRSYCMVPELAVNIGIYGFGAAAHIVIQLARHQYKQVFAFTRPGDDISQKFALQLGAVWAGDSTQRPPEKMDAAIIFAPVGQLVPQALLHLGKGGMVICGGIYMSDIPSFPYKLLWQERSIKSVANLTRADGRSFLAVAPTVPIHTHITTYPLQKANEAIYRLRQGGIEGAAVLVM
ncbi:zinc-dependent alcohol dehydrogenase family protein [Foetidibacter luteolus]|uniref:zinc-dependent alcohol dehydrogenase family protein n=1 Tax=Foetidibacter luteolus TaxID=2608880 RepID=UPI001A985271|nr:zinc-dependent alcohol dehydrogenase family protein [Foetidibacter luteolus]